MTFSSVVERTSGGVNMLHAFILAWSSRNLIGYRDVNWPISAHLWIFKEVPISKKILKIFHGTGQVFQIGEISQWSVIRQCRSIPSINDYHIHKLLGLSGWPNFFLWSYDNRPGLLWTRWQTNILMTINY